MIRLDGPIWQEIGRANVILVPGCNAFRKNGDLIMCAGAPKECLEHFPHLARFLGPKAKKRERRGFYGIVTHAYRSDDFEFRLGVFQTKGHYSGQPNPWLFKKSAALLAKFAHQHERIALNIDQGTLHDSKVWPLLEAFGDNLIIYTQPAAKPVRKSNEPDYDAMSDDELRAHLSAEQAKRDARPEARPRTDEQKAARLETAFCMVRAISECCHAPWDTRAVFPKGHRYAGHGSYLCSNCGHLLFHV